MPQESGRNLYDLLSEIASRYGLLLLIVVLLAAISTIVWVHTQTIPGEKVTLLGYELYRKKPLTSAVPLPSKTTDDRSSKRTGDPKSQAAETSAPPSNT